MQTQWEILPYARFGSVAFDMSRDDVSEALGPPERVDSMFFHYARLLATVGFDLQGRCNWVATSPGPVVATVAEVDLTGDHAEIVARLVGHGHATRQGAVEEGDAGSTYVDDLGVYLWREDSDEPVVDTVAAYRRGYWEAGHRERLKRSSRPSHKGEKRPGRSGWGRRVPLSSKSGSGLPRRNRSYATLLTMRKTASRTVYENRWMTVREDEIERADGSSGIYGIVEKADFALVIPFDGDGFYLVEQYRYPVGGHFREFPQGSWEADPDADRLALARGELMEETGLQAGSMEHLGHLYEAYGFSTQGFDVYLATDLTQGTPAPTIEEEDLRVERVTVADFEQLVRDGHIKDAPSVAGYSLLQLREDFG